MLKFLLPLCMLMASSVAYSQLPGRCGILEAQEYLYSQDKTAKQRIAGLLADAAQQQSAAQQANPQARPSSAVNYTIPVVFHVLHLGGPENISDAQIFDEMAILNRDYTKQNADTSNVVSQFQGLIGNPNVEFRLATKDPNGNCTNGITRHYDPQTDWTTYNLSNYTYTWDRTKYLNIYVVRNTPSGAAAYANYPGAVPAYADAVVVGSTYVGSIGTSSPYTSRVITHEIGHWMNLEHPWGNNNGAGVSCGDDGVNDTPLTKGFLYCNLNSAIVCTPNVTENMQNYMDYAYCQRMFTKGQCTRMQSALNSSIAGRNNIWTNSNLIATGVLNPLSNCAPVAQFVSNNTITCVGNSLSFLDDSYNAPITSWLWSSPQASNTSAYQNGTLTFTASGIASVKLKVSNASGSDSTVQQKVIVLAAAGSGSTNLVQGFENINFPDNAWLAIIPSAGTGFQQNSFAAFNGFKCAWVDNYSNGPAVPVSFYSPAFNLQNADNSAQLSFYNAYSQKSASDNGTFKIYGSTNCGSGWTQVYSAAGTNLSTTGAPQNTAFTNPGFDQWQQHTVNVGSYFAGASKVYFKFEFTPDATVGSNNFYIDDINLHTTGATGLNEQAASLQNISVSPNPFSGNLVISGDGVDKVSSFSLFDISGRVLVTQGKPVVKQNVLEINDLDRLTNGIYFIRVNTQQGSKVLKLIKE